jgi:hypothetical protein
LGLQIANPQITNSQGRKAFTRGLAEVLCLQKKLGLQIANPQITNSLITIKDWVYKLQIRKVLVLRKVCKSIKF